MFHFDLTTILASIPAIVITLSMFSFAEALVANWLGDPTAKLAGRLTISPLSHLEPIGTLLMVLIGFGWPKPVPINPNNFKDPRRDTMLVTFAGPVMGVLLGFIFTFVFVLLDIAGMTSSGLSLVLQFIILYNIGIALFCLLPFPGFPGFNLILPWLPLTWQYRYYQLGWFNLVFLIILINTPILSVIIRPLQVNIFNIYFHIIQAILG